MIWSKIPQKEMQRIKDYYDLNRLEYHNWQHITECYGYLESEGVEYDEDLDYAVAYHDAIYDKEKQKEYRSGLLLLDHFPDKLNAAGPIMATVDHKIDGLSETSKHLVRADLHQMAMYPEVLENYTKIMKESIKLYGIDKIEFAENNVAFMDSLAVTVKDNQIKDSDKYIEFWDNVLRGIELTTQVSKIAITLQKGK